MDIATNDIYKTIKVFCRSEEFIIKLDNEDYDGLQNLDFVIVKQRGYATVNVYTDKILKTRKSLGKLILKTERNVYMKDRYISINRNILDYRKDNLTINIKDIQGYSDLARENYYKNEDKIIESRCRDREYTIEISNRCMKGKTGEGCYNSKLTRDIVKEIRNKYELGCYTQEKLARQYNVSKSTISSIITFKRWKDVDDKSKRNYNELVVKELIEKNKTFRDRLSYDSIELNKTYYLAEENLFYYLEDLNNDGLVYVEVRDSKKDVLLRGDLYFLDDFNNQTKREYSIATKYPVKTPTNLFIQYVDKLKEYL